MEAKVRRWVARNRHAPDIGSYQTTVTIFDRTCTSAWTFPGRLTRKAALERVWREMLQDSRVSRVCMTRFREEVLDRREVTDVECCT